MINPYLDWPGITIPKPTRDESREIWKWCELNFGTKWMPLLRSKGIWSVNWENGINSDTYTWHFKYHKDAMLFSLRWS
jgi:hypothetical protein